MTREQELNKLVKEIENQEANISTIDKVILICDSHKSCDDCNYYQNGCMFKGKSVKEMEELLCLKLK